MVILLAAPKEFPLFILGITVEQCPVHYLQKLHLELLIIPSVSGVEIDWIPNAESAEGILHCFHYAAVLDILFSKHISSGEKISVLNLQFGFSLSQLGF